MDRVFHLHIQGFNIEEDALLQMPGGKANKKKWRNKEVDLEGGIGNDKGRESCAENLPASTDTDMK